MKKANLKEVSEYLEKTHGTVKSWNARQPKLKELCLLGMTCKKNNIDLSKLLKIIDMFETVKFK